MKRVTQGGDINFNASDIRGLGSTYTIKFYTTDKNNYILKSDGDVIDGIIRLEWTELETLGNGVLNYIAENITSNPDYDDGTYNQTFSRTTDYYIMAKSNGGDDGSYAELAQKIALEIQRSTNKDNEHDEEISSINTRLSNIYTKTEVDGLIDSSDKLPEGIVIDSNYVHTDNNYTTSEKTKLAGLENYDDTTINTQMRLMQSSIDNCYTKSEVDNKFTYISNRGVYSDEIGIADTEAGNNIVLTHVLTGPNDDVDTLKLFDDNNGYELLIPIDGQPYVHTDNNYTTAEKNKLANTYTKSEVNDLLDGIGTGGSSDFTINIIGDTIYITSNRPNVYASTTSIEMTGSTKTAQFTVSGVNLKGNISITTDNAAFNVTPSTLTPTEGTVEQTTVTVRYNGTQTASCNITISSANAASVAITTDYTAVYTPTLSFDSNTINITSESGVAATGTVILNGTNLSGNATISVNGNGYSVSPTTATASAVMQGQTITVTRSTSATGTNATITATCDNVTATTSVVWTEKVTESEAEGSIVTRNVGLDNNGSPVGIKFKVTKPSENGANGEVCVTDMNGEEAKSVTDNYPNLYSLTLPSSITINGNSYAVVKVGRLVLANCPNLTSIVIPDSVTNIGSGLGQSFINSPVSYFKVGNGINSVNTGGYVNFGTDLIVSASTSSNAAALKTVDLGSNISYLHRQFRYCTGITSLTMRCNSVMQMSADGQKLLTNPLEHIYVPSAQVDAYKADTNWSQFANIIESINN